MFDVRGPIATSAWIALIVTLFLSPFGHPVVLGPGTFLTAYALNFAVISMLAVALASLNRR